MPLAIGYTGYVYDTSEPLFVKVGAGMVVNRLSGAQVEVQSLLDAMTAEGYTAKPGEIDISATWEQDNTGWWTYDGITPQQPPAQLPTVIPTQGIPADGDQGGAAVIDLDFHGNNVPVGGLTATIVYDIGGGDATLTAALTAGMTPSQASGAIEAKLNGVTEFTATKVGNTITVTPGAGTTISKMVVSIA